VLLTRLFSVKLKKFLENERIKVAVACSDCTAPRLAILMVLFHVHNRFNVEREFSSAHHIHSSFHLKFIGSQSRATGISIQQSAQTAPLLGPTFWPQVPGTSSATVLRIQVFHGDVGHGLDSRVMAYGGVLTASERWGQKHTVRCRAVLAGQTAKRASNFEAKIARYGHSLSHN